MRRLRRPAACQRLVSQGREQRLVSWGGALCATRCVTGAGLCATRRGGRACAQRVVSRGRVVVSRAGLVRNALCHGGGSVRDALCHGAGLVRNALCHRVLGGFEPLYSSEEIWQGLQGQRLIQVASGPIAEMRRLRRPAARQRLVSRPCVIGGALCATRCVTARPVAQRVVSRGRVCAQRLVSWHGLLRNALCHGGGAARCVMGRLCAQRFVSWGRVCAQRVVWRGRACAKRVVARGRVCAQRLVSWQGLLRNALCHGGRGALCATRCVTGAGLCATRCVTGSWVDLSLCIVRRRSDKACKDNASSKWSQGPLPKCAAWGGRRRVSAFVSQGRAQHVASWRGLVRNALSHGGACAQRVVSRGRVCATPCVMAGPVAQRRCVTGAGLRTTPCVMGGGLVRNALCHRGGPVRNASYHGGGPVRNASCHGGRSVRNALCHGTACCATRCVTGGRWGGPGAQCVVSWGRVCARRVNHGVLGGFEPLFSSEEIW